MVWRQGKTLNGDAVVFYGVEIFMLFFSIWDVCCCWMQDDYVARVLPNEVRSTEISWWSGRRISNKANK
jgi:hypothetical protein